jgi:ribonuclease HII
METVEYKTFRFVDYKVYHESKKWFQEIVAISGVVEDKELYKALKSNTLNIALNIASASILAKTYRDDYMNRLDKQFPMYDWRNNKGYPTKKHREAIQKHGTTPHHRLTFKLLEQQTKLDI